MRSGSVSYSSRQPCARLRSTCSGSRAWSQPRCPRLSRGPPSARRCSVRKRFRSLLARCASRATSRGASAATAACATSRRLSTAGTAAPWAMAGSGAAAARARRGSRTSSRFQPWRRSRSASASSTSTFSGTRSSASSLGAPWRCSPSAAGLSRCRSSRTSAFLERTRRRLAWWSTFRERRASGRRRWRSRSTPFGSTSSSLAPRSSRFRPRSPRRPLGRARRGQPPRAFCCASRTSRGGSKGARWRFCTRTTRRGLLPKSSRSRAAKGSASSMSPASVRSWTPLTFSRSPTLMRSPCVTRSSTRPSSRRKAVLSTTTTAWTRRRG
mmetsp:Transcript_24583/g.80335  ORF Transcript_24583/g.80335 Transcript_24583/m.80335 type:complete len:326 (+) Transcript_24583:997-1974(+)